MRKRRTLPALGLAILIACGGASPAPPRNPGDTPTIVRELFVPIEDMHILLEHDPHRVMLSRDEYEKLLAQVERESVLRPPMAAMLADAVYDAHVEEERAVIRGELRVNVMDAGLHTVDLPFSGVGLRSATLDGKPAPMGVGEDGRVRLFVEGKGMHVLKVEMVTPIETSAARQVLNIQLPTPSATRLRLKVPGDVEIVSGAETISREVDENGEETRFELVPKRDRLAIVMTLNSRTKRQDRVVIARSVMVDEVTQGYERLHATFSLEVLHRGVDRFEWNVPEGFEIKEVRSNELARWSVEERDGRSNLIVHLRDANAGTFVVHIAAERLDIPWDDWSFPRLQPVEVEGHVAVLGLLLEERIQATRIRDEQLIPIDTTSLMHALPPSVINTEVGVLRVRPIVAYYAPQRDFTLQSTFIRPEPRFRINENLLLTLSDAGHHLRGGLTLAPEVRAVFDFTFTLPADWQLLSIRSADNQELAYERFESEGGVIRYHVRLPQGVAPAADSAVFLEAEARPSGWLDEWTSRELPFPQFTIEEATHVTGALAVAVRDDLAVRHETLERLEPLDDDEKPKYGLGDVPTALAYRFNEQDYRAVFHVSRLSPRMTGRSWSFFTVAPDVLHAHYELRYEVSEARARSVSFSLPVDTPPSITIHGLDGVTVKEHASTEADGRRRWLVHLAQPRLGPVRLAVTFQQPLPEEEQKNRALPIPVLQDVLYQSGFVSVEGDAELDVSVSTDLNKVDVGELVDAHYMPGKRLLGVYRYVGDDPTVRFSATRHPFHELKSVIVERAEIDTVLSAHGRAQSVARYALRTKTDYLEVVLPTTGSELWSVRVDGQPAKPQRLANKLLISLPPQAHHQLRDLQIVFESPVKGVDFRNRLELLAPELYVSDGTQAQQVPTADLRWNLHFSEGMELLDTGGTLTTDDVRKPELAIVAFTRDVFDLAGGFNLFYQKRGRFALARARELYTSVDSNLDANAVSAGDHEFEEDGKFVSEFWLGEMTDFAPQQPGKPESRLEGVAGDELVNARAIDRLDADTNGRVAPAGGQPPQPAVSSWAMLGIRSLPIDLELSAHPVVFRSLGDRPQLEVTLASASRTGALRLGLAGIVVLVGLALTRSKARRKWKFLLIVALVTTLVPLLFGRAVWAPVLNASFYAAALMGFYYLLVAILTWVITQLQAMKTPTQTLATAGVALALLIGASHARAQEATDLTIPVVVEGTEIQFPVSVPDDVIIVPYDSEKGTGIKDVQQILVPYAKYIELRNLAWPDQRIATEPPPAPYAWAGGGYTATLTDADELLLEGTLYIDVYTDEFVTVPLPLAGGVLSLAEVDGKPARLSAIQAEAQPVPQIQQQAAPNPQQRSRVRPDALVAIHLQGKGRHEFKLAVRVPLQRQGGWRLADVQLPTATATALDLTVRDPQTELRLRGVQDRTSYLTTEPGQRIASALEMNQPLRIQWRPRITEGQVDRTLTAQSDALFDVQEDGLRMTWQCRLKFERGERDMFQFILPGEYLIAKVAGENVRGWETRDEEGGRILEVRLLKPARDQETIMFHLWRQGEVGGELSDIIVPQIVVRDAALHQGLVALRRSPLIELRTTRSQAVTRDDYPEQSPLIPLADDQSPLGLKGFQAYRFAATPFTVQLTADPESSDFNFVTRTIFRISQHEQSLETEITLTSTRRPLFQVSIQLPDDLRLDNVVAPGPFEWVVVQEEGQQRLDIHLAIGQLGSTRIALFGKLGPYDLDENIPLPQLQVLNARSGMGDIAVQVDPDYSVEARDLEHLTALDLKRDLHWINENQRALIPLALRYHQTDYAGQIRLSERVPQVNCRTITNLRITEQAVQETILLDYDVKYAGVRSLSFLLPAGMKDARIRVPQLRQKTITPVSGEAGAPLRVTLELQDKILGQIRVLVEEDRLLTRETHEAPIPQPENAREVRRFVVLESAGREEVEIVDTPGLVPLSRQQQQWDTLASILGNRVTQAFLVEPEATRAALAVKTRPRALVETAGARIGLSQTILVVDAQGTYRAEQTYKVDNSTEQYLEIELPDLATLWTAYVAGDPVKPTQMPAPAKQSQVRIPLVKTAAGDLDYEVKLKYGGGLGSFSATSGVQFPFIKTLNINVELSQVELYLPEEYAWFDFDGTMTQVTDEGDYLADLVAYETKLIEKLSRTMRSDSEYAKVRALSNWENLKKSKMDRREQAQQGAMQDNPRLQQELRSNEAAIEFAERQQEQAAEVFEVDLGGDNRSQLGEYFERQTNTRARGAVQDVGVNFDYRAIQKREGKQAKGQDFDEQWFASNSLAMPQQPESGPGSVSFRGSSAATPPAQTAGKDKIAAGAGNIVLDLDLYQDAAKPSAPLVGQREMQQLIDGKAISKEMSSQFSYITQQDGQEATQTQSESLNRAQRYKQRLDEAVEGQKAGSGPGAPADRAASSRFGGYGRESGVPREEGRERLGIDGPQVGTTGGIVTDDFAGTITITGGAGTDSLIIANGDVDADGVFDFAGMGAGYSSYTAPAAPEGLASLDVNIPQKGRVFRFSTPRGDVRISARAVSDDSIRGSKQAGRVLVLILLLVAGYRIFRPDGILTRHPRRTANVLMLVSILGLILGTLPVASLVLLIVGIVCRIRAMQMTQPATA